MKLRRHIFPTQLRDFLCMSFIILVMPIGYCFEVFIVFPTLHEIPSLGYVVHILFATYLLINTAGNYVFLVITDTSVQKPVTPDMIVNYDSWRFCKVCGTFIPLRSWHCDSCNACILRRDHHCLFSGCCVGYKNYRYFIHFLLSFCFSSLYMLVLNTHFVSRFFEAGHMTLLLNLMFPLVFLWFLRPPFFSPQQWCVVVLAINLLGAVVSLVLVWTYVSRLLRGLVFRASDPDSGRTSVSQVLGRRWYLTWLSPLVTSDLPDDDEQWTTSKWDKTKIV